MIRLASTDLLSLVTAQNGAEVVASYNDRTATAYGPGNTQVTDISSATTTTILSSPAASTVREPDEISIKNTFAGSHTMTLNFNRSATLYVILTATLLENERIEYTHAAGWKALTASGGEKVGGIYTRLYGRSVPAAIGLFEPYKNDAVFINPPFI